MTRSRLQAFRELRIGDLSYDPVVMLELPRTLFRSLDDRLRERARARKPSRLVKKLVKLSNALQGTPARHEDIFCRRFGVRELDDPEHGSFSGPGSTLERTAAIREALPDLLQELRCKTFIDAPCGDFKWMQAVELPVERYIGVDVIRELIAVNQARFGNEQRSFRHLNLVRDVLPQGDLVLNRDMLIHLSFEDIGRFLGLLHASGCRYLLTSHFPGRSSNRDIRTGQHRAVDLEIAPFHFPPPLRTISERYTANTEHVAKCLALWEIKDLPDRL